LFSNITQTIRAYEETRGLTSSDAWIIFKGDEIGFSSDESPLTGVHFESQFEFLQWHLGELEKSVTKLTLISDFCKLSIDNLGQFTSLRVHAHCFACPLRYRAVAGELPCRYLLSLLSAVCRLLSADCCLPSAC
jgi:hypothetical protein